MSVAWYEGFLDLVSDLTGVPTCKIASECIEHGLTNRRKVLAELELREATIQRDITKPESER